MSKKHKTKLTKEQKRALRQFRDSQKMVLELEW